ncbi:hypothetical protein [Agrobacterium sp. OT33]|uniref:hypothetical protein n=1 Tax=Agrobacterium sp. OT33 TaxID=2815338 RepID=UPI001A8FBCF8|nr:hypothetical protein [Agrobacterium sp. OT33]
MGSNPILSAIKLSQDFDIIGQIGLLVCFSVFIPISRPEWLQTLPAGVNCMRRW